MLKLTIRAICYLQTGLIIEKPRFKISILLRNISREDEEKVQKLIQDVLADQKMEEKVFFNITVCFASFGYSKDMKG